MSRRQDVMATRPKNVTDLEEKQGDPGGAALQIGAPRPWRGSFRAGNPVGAREIEKF